MLVIFIHLTKILLEKLASFSQHHDESTTTTKGWPELVRASIGIIISVYVMQKIISSIIITIEGGTLIESLVLAGGRSGLGIMFIILMGVMDYPPPTSKWALSLILILAVSGVIWRETSGGTSSHNDKSMWDWLQLLLSTHAVLVGYASSSSRSDALTRNACMFFTAVIAQTGSGSPQMNILTLLMILPALCLKGKEFISECIIPILDLILHTDLYPLKDPKKVDARNALLMQQNQEILFYIMAWCVLLGLWAHVRPSVLVCVQIVGGIMYLASLRRYSNIARIRGKEDVAVSSGSSSMFSNLNMIHMNVRKRPTTTTQLQEVKVVESSKNDQHHSTILTKLMQKSMTLTKPNL